MQNRILVWVNNSYIFIWENVNLCFSQIYNMEGRGGQDLDMGSKFRIEFSISEWPLKNEIIHFKKFFSKISEHSFFLNASEWLLLKILWRNRRCSSDIASSYFAARVKSGACYITGQWEQVQNNIKRNLTLTLKPLTFYIFL